MARLEGKVALVTGAAGGAGPAVVRTLAEAGATILAVGRREAELAALGQTMNLPADRWSIYPVDLTDSQATQRMVEVASSRWGGIDILAALAGGWRGGFPVASTELDTLDWSLRINVVTAFNACRAVLPGMIARGWGRIIAVGARSAVGGQARSGAYAASKAALVALVQTIALETRNQGITANVVLASTIDTPANRAAMPDADFSRWVHPTQLAATIGFLCTDEAAAISGAAIPAYGRA